MQSSAPLARANLLTALQARPNLAGVQIKEAIPAGDKMAQECIYLAKTVWDREEGKLSGDTRRRERYNIEIQVHVLQAGDDAAAVDARAWALFAEVESQLVNPTGDPTLGGAVLVAELRPVEHTPGWAQGVRVGIIDANVYCVNDK